MESVAVTISDDVKHAQSLPLIKMCFIKLSLRFHATKQKTSQVTIIH